MPPLFIHTFHTLYGLHIKTCSKYSVGYGSMARWEVQCRGGFRLVPVQQCCTDSDYVGAILPCWEGFRLVPIQQCCVGSDYVAASNYRLVPIPKYYVDSDYVGASTMLRRLQRAALAVAVTGCTSLFILMAHTHLPGNISSTQSIGATDNKVGCYN